jgi:tetratricopeptide (TPR) repeat protein
VDVHLERGYAASKKGDLGRAIDELSEALRLDPESAEAFDHRGWCHRQKKEFEEAIADFTEAIKLGRVGCYAQRGDAYFQKGDDEQALADLGRAVQVDPRNDWAWWVKSVVMTRKGDHGATVVCLDRANGITPKSEYWIARGQRSSG